MEARRTKFAAFPALLPELDLVEAADQVWKLYCYFFSFWSNFFFFFFLLDSSRDCNGWWR